MSYAILNLSEKTIWTNYLKKLTAFQQDIFYTPQYYQLLQYSSTGKAICFVYEEGNQIAIYPFLMNSVNKLGYNLKNEYFDIQGAYGYNGVISSCLDQDFIENFHENFNGFCSSHKIIAEFTRFHPVIKNNQFSINHLNIIKEMDNVIFDLTDNDFLYNSYKHSTRKNINKAERNNLRVDFYEGKAINDSIIDEFYNIYNDTMYRNNAASYYYFNKEFFTNLFEQLKGNVLLAFTKYKKDYISTEIIPFGSKIAYSFLGGTIADFFHLRPNDLLKHNIILELRKRGLHYFCLGGGSEGIINFKATFSKNGIIPFYIGKKIHNQTIYQEIVEQWKEKYPTSYNKHKNMLLGYREINV